MAEKEVGASGDVVANHPSAVEEVPGSAAELVRSAPEPAKDGGKIYKVMYPTDNFVVAGHPVVDSTGVRLTDEQSKTVLEAAEASGVRIVEVSE